MKLDKYISKLLYDYECVIIPGFGGLVTNYSSVKIHPAQHTFSPPSKDISFNSNLITNDGLIANFISESENITYPEALGIVLQEVDSYKTTLANKGKVVIENIGSFSLNVENNIQFEPDRSINYLIDSFGLTSIQSNPIKRAGIQERLEKQFKNKPAIKQEHKKTRIFKLKYLAALPVLVLAVWSYFNTSTINNYYHNYSSLIPFLNSEMKQTDKLVNVSKTKVNTETIKVKDESISSATDNTITSTSDADVKVKTSDVEVSKESKEISDNKETGTKYYIIGGCFKMMNNASNFVAELNKKGFKAEIVDQAPNGLYRVSCKSFSTQEQAEEELGKLKSVNTSAWILTK